MWDLIFWAVVISAPFCALRIGWITFTDDIRTFGFSQKGYKTKASKYRAER